MCGKLGHQPMSLLAGTGAGEKWGRMREGLWETGLEEGIGTLPPNLSQVARPPLPHTHYHDICLAIDLKAAKLSAWGVRPVIISLTNLYSFF